MRIKNIFTFFFVLTSSLLISACSQENTAGKEKMTLNIGMPPSAHNILIEKVVKPVLEKEGYTINFYNFSSLRDANTALVEGSIDFHTAQHQAYLDVYNKETGNNLVSLVHTPSIPAFIYSVKQKSLDAIKEGDTVLIPNDPSNAARSYALLQKIGWINLDPSINLSEITRQNIINNPKNLQFKEVDSALIPRLLDEVDFGIMPGGVAFLAGLSSDYALAHETFLPELELMATVKTADLQTQWAKDVKKAFQSGTMKDFILNDPEIKGRFIWPEN